jgi:hypothetical protein
MVCRIRNRGAVTPIKISAPLKSPHANKVFVARNYTLADLNCDLYEVQHIATHSSTPETRVGGVRKEAGHLIAFRRQSTPTR